MQKPLIIITGATASGKTDIAIKLAKKLNTDIISADSMQIYKYMDIGTAKPTIEEMQGVKHYLIDDIFPDEKFSIAIFQEKVLKIINSMYKSDKIPIICGGTGFYINSIIYDNNFKNNNTDDEEFRKKLFYIAETKGNEFLHDMLEKIDDESAKKIHKNNVKRVVRAIEFYKQTGQKISEHNAEEKQRTKKFNTATIILNRERNNLYKRIDDRVNLMIQNGLLQEVKSLLEKGYSKELLSMQGLGYKEMIQYINNDISLEKAIEILKRDTRRYSKRQLTWFRHQTDGYWINLDEKSNPIDEIENYCKEKFFIR